MTIPLSFIVGIVSLLAPERLAQQKFADVEQQIHLGYAVLEPVNTTAVTE